MVEDSGTFSVRAENAGGAAKSSANLVVEGIFLSLNSFSYSLFNHFQQLQKLKDLLQLLLLSKQFKVLMQKLESL